MKDETEDTHDRTLARPETNRRLEEILQRMQDEPGYAKRFLNSDACIRREYAGNVPLRVVPADEEITEDCGLDLGGVRAQICYAASPHTDDALLVCVPGDRTVFIGDAQLGRFPSWRMDFEKLDELARQIGELDVRTVIDGHGSPYTKEDFLAEL